MEGIEEKGQLGPTGLPFGILAQLPVRNVAQGTMLSTEMGANEVRQLTDHGSVSVADADQSPFAVHSWERSASPSHRGWGCGSGGATVSTARTSTPQSAQRTEFEGLGPTSPLIHL